MKCPKCGVENSETAKFCSLCLAKFTEDCASKCPTREPITEQDTKENFLYALLDLSCTLIAFVAVAMLLIFLLGRILVITGIGDFISAIIDLATNPFGLIFLLFLAFLITGILAFIKYLNSK